MRLANLLAEEDRLAELEEVAAASDDPAIRWLVVGALAEADQVDAAISAWRTLRSLPSKGFPTPATVEAWGRFERALVQHKRLDVLGDLAAELPRAVLPFGALLVSTAGVEDAVATLRQMAAKRQRGAARALAEVLVNAGRADEVLDLLVELEEDHPFDS